MTTDHWLDSGKTSQRDVRGNGATRRLSERVIEMIERLGSRYHRLVLVKVAPIADETRAARLDSRSPASSAKMKQRFGRYPGGFAKRREPDKVRLLLE